MRQVAEIEEAEKDKMRNKCKKIIDHGVNVFVNRQLIYNFPEQARYRSVLGSPLGRSTVCVDKKRTYHGEIWGCASNLLRLWFSSGLPAHRRKSKILYNQRCNTSTTPTVEIESAKHPIGPKVNVFSAVTRTFLMQRNSMDKSRGKSEEAEEKLQPMKTPHVHVEPVHENGSF